MSFWGGLVNAVGDVFTGNWGGAVGDVVGMFSGGGGDSPSATPDPSAGDWFSGMTSAPAASAPSGTTSSLGSVLGPITPAVGAIGAGALSYYGQQQTNVANATQAQQQMAFQNEQTSTAYQRAVKDMEAAGLNPMLAYDKGGASSGSGAMATMGNAVGAGVSGAQQGAQTVAQLQNLQAATAKTQMDTINSALTGPLIEAQTGASQASAAQAEATTRKTEQERSNLMTQNMSQWNQVAWENATLPERVAFTANSLKLGLLQSQLQGLQVPEAQSRANFWRSDAGAQAPYGEYMTGGGLTGSIARSLGVGFGQLSGSSGRGAASQSGLGMGAYPPGF